MVPVVLRYDDYSEISNTELERKLFSTIAGRGGKISVSVVPFVAGVDWKPRGPIGLLQLSKAKAELLKEFMPAVLEPLVHGYSHQTVSGLSGMGEFADSIDCQLQLERLKDAKAMLENSLARKMDVFVPPWNVYGKNTIAVLKEAGFSAISGDATYGPIVPGVKYIPCTCSLAELPAAVRAAKKKRSAEAFVCALFHDYDFLESGSGEANLDMKAFEGILDNVEAEGGKLISFADCLSQGDWGAERASANQLLGRQMTMPARFFAGHSLMGVYWSAGFALRQARLLGHINKLRFWGR